MKELIQALEKIQAITRDMETRLDPDRHPKTLKLAQQIDDIAFFAIKKGKEYENTYIRK